MLRTDATLAELAVQHPAASKVFQRHGLDFCCHGNRSFTEACRERGLVADDIVAAIESEDRIYDHAPRWQQRPIPELILHIRNFYHDRLRAELPQLVEMADKVERAHRDKSTCPRGLSHHLKVMHIAVLEHLAKEEQILFPIILDGRGRRASAPIHMMEVEHEDHAENLSKIRALTANLVPPPEACPTWRALYLRLAAMESELMEHIHLENNVLFRRALCE